ncbi:MAG: hypothetical protein D6701_11405 [Gemmatimonadetes bacterium]|nr:MAG: hypothetical protein D6701_11405 [Gemmatimonadota bacterium]
MRVISLPGTLDYRTSDQVFAEVGEDGADKVMFDARHVRWVDPPGMVNLLAAGTRVRDRQGAPPHLEMPETEVAGYMARMGFFRAAQGIFDFEPPPARRATGESDVLLEVTSISTNSDVHEVVDRVQGRAGAILSRVLNYPASAVVQFSVILSEVCQNVLEHAEGPGWVAAQRYNWEQRLGRRVVVIGVTDLGRGFRGSLAEEHSGRFGDRWGDATALEAAFIHGLTRFPDSGRGQGIQQIRKQVRRWNGFISIRSGTARIADVPEWDTSPPLEDELAPFPGAQITIILPERRPEDG